MPMQLAEACMSAEFINLHLLWDGGEGRRWRRRWGEGGGKQHACRLCFSQTGEWVERDEGRKWDRKKEIKRNRSEIYQNMYWYYASCLQPDGAFPHRLLFLSGPDSLLSCHCCHGLVLKAAQGGNPISTVPFASQQSFQSLALDSLLWSGFRPLMNSDDGDKRWWHSPLMSGTCRWSLEFLMKWIEFCKRFSPVLSFFSSFQWKKKWHNIRLWQHSRDTGAQSWETGTEFPWTMKHLSQIRP